MNWDRAALPKPCTDRCVQWRVSEKNWYCRLCGAYATDEHVRSKNHSKWVKRYGDDFLFFGTDNEDDFMPHPPPRPQPVPAAPGSSSGPDQDRGSAQRPPVQPSSGAVPTPARSASAPAAAWVAASAEPPGAGSATRPHFVVASVVSGSDPWAPPSWAPQHVPGGRPRPAPAQTPAAPASLYDEVRNMLALLLDRLESLGETVDALRASLAAGTAAAGAHEV